MVVALVPTTSISNLSLPFSKPRNIFHFPTKPRSQFLCCLSLDQEIPSVDPTTTAVSDGAAAALRVVLAGGGSGGHIYPAVAIADEIRARNPAARILFIGTATGMETTAVPSAGYDFAAISPTPVTRPVFSLRNIGLPYYVIKSMLECRKIMDEFKPHVVIGTGGYVSFPVCLLAYLTGLRMVIQEQNSSPGVSDFILSFFADLVFVAYNSTVESFPVDKRKIVVSGNPVRLSLRKFVPKAAALAYYFPKSDKAVESDAKVVLVLGGSKGANHMNIALLNFYRQLLTEREELHIIWEAGVESFDEMESLVRSHPRLVLAPFLHSMDMAYAAADLVVSRAGALTCSELLVTGKPAILIPSPYVEEGLQSKNAALMADLAGSRIITEDELDSTTLRSAIKDILDNELLMRVMSERAFQAAKPNAGAEIAERIISLVDLPSTKKQGKES